jgi:hypothetical protein
MTRRLALWCVAIAQTIGTAAAAGLPVQDAVVDRGPSDPPAHIALVDGAATLERDGQSEPAPANMPLLAGDRVRTEVGRVEILFADGSALHLDTQTTVDFQSDELLRLLDGRLRLAIPGALRRVAYRIDAPSARVDITQPGEYRVNVSRTSRGDEVELAVLRGAADLVNDGGRTPLRAGEHAWSRAEAAPSYAYAYNSARWDAFDRWSEARRAQRLGVSTQYLPGEVRPYAATLDQYGSWSYAADYGYVWYPKVAVGWRPYYHGRWSVLRPYGWTWIGADPWAWPTHHYGRWGFSAGAWFWVPGATWGAAWVSWAYAPGYVSWCPLGWNNAPIFAVNVHHHGYSPWHAWTVVPAHHFRSHRFAVSHVAIRPHAGQFHGAFVSRPRGPAVPQGYAVPRGSVPIHRPGTLRASTGGGPSTVYTNLSAPESRVPGSGPRVMVGGTPSPNVARPRQDTTPAGTQRTFGTAPNTAARAGVPSAGPGIDQGATVDAGRPNRAVPRNDQTFASQGVPSARVPRASLSRESPTVAPGAPAVEPRRTEAPVPIYRGSMPQRPTYESPAYTRPSGPPPGSGYERAPGWARPREITPAAPVPPNIERRSAPSGRPSGPPPSAGGAPRGPDGGGGRVRSGGQPAQGTAVARPRGRE